MINPGSPLNYLGFEATEADITKAIKDPNARYCEWQGAGITFILSLDEKGGTIVRTGAMGGDILDVHGGWRYLKRDHALKEWFDIIFMEGEYKRRKR